MHNTDKPRLVILDMDRQLTYEEHIKEKDYFQEKVDIMFYYHQSRNYSSPYCEAIIINEKSTVELENEIYELFSDVKIEYDAYMNEEMFFRVFDMTKEAILNVIASLYKIELKLFSIEKLQK